MWVTKNVKKEIAIKRIINKKRRKATNGITALRLKKEFYLQKEKINLQLDKKLKTVKNI